MHLAARPFLDRLLAHERFVLTTHVRPDGDAIGSTLALAHLLRAMGKTATVLLSDPAPDTLAFLPGVADALVYDPTDLAHREALATATARVLLDANALDRTGRLASTWRDGDAELFVIDHHTHPENWFAAAYAREDAASTCELVAELVTEAGVALTADLATLLYTGTMTDTGSFRFANTSPAVHRLAADLVAAGVDVPRVHQHVFENKRLGALRLLARALDTIALHHGGRVASMAMPLKMLRASDAHTDETEGFVNYALSVEGVEAAVLFTETGAGVKASFRSKGDVPVNGWARAFGGGGHVNASGAFFPKAVFERVVAQVLAAAPRHLGFAGADDGADDAAAAATTSDEDAAYLALLRDKLQTRR